MFQYSDEPDLVFNFTTANQKDIIIAQTYRLERDRVQTVANTSHALRYAAEYGFQSLFGSRPLSRKFIILISNGNWIDTEDFILAVETLAPHNISFIGVAAGSDLILLNLQTVFDPCYLFYVRDNDFSSLDVLAFLTKRVMCK